MKDLAYKNVPYLTKIIVLQNAHVIPLTQLIIIRLTILNARQTQRLTHPTLDSIVNAEITTLLI